MRSLTEEVNDLRAAASDVAKDDEIPDKNVSDHGDDDDDEIDDEIGGFDGLLSLSSTI